jgi:hypothetical protein
LNDWSFWVEAGHEPDRMMSIPISAHEQAGGLGRAGCNTDRVRRHLPAVCASGPVTVSHGNPARRGVAIPCPVGRMSQLHPAISLLGSASGCVRQTLNAPTCHCQISLRVTARTALTHGLVNGFGCQRTAAPLAPCCNGAAQSFFPWAAPIPRGSKKPRSAPSSTALRPCGCSSANPCLKPAIEAANERGVRPTRRN